MDYWYSILYWKLRAVTERSTTVSRLLENIRLKCALQADPLLRVMKSQVTPGSVIYDVGAHVGTYSLVLAKGVRDSLVYSFEPNLQSYLKLTKNISLMKVEANVIPQNIALGSLVGKHILHISSASGRTSLYKEHAESNGSQVISTSVVDCYSVDYLVANELCKPPDVIKIDVEGHEYEVIKGAQNTIASKAPQIFLEPHGVGQSYAIQDFLGMNFNYACESLGYPI